MALIPVYHVVASMFAVDAGSATDIPQGVLLTLGTDGKAIACDGASAWAVAVAADSRSAGVTSYTATSNASLSRNPKTSLTGAITIGSQGSTRRFTQNRVSDNYNEVLASGKITGYHSGGEFWTDQYEIIRSNGSTVCSYTPAKRLYASTVETPGTGEASIAQVGRFTDETSTTTQVVGFVVNAPTEYPSGVPGTGVNSKSGLSGFEGGNSISYGTMLHLKLAI